MYPRPQLLEAFLSLINSGGMEDPPEILSILRPIMILMSITSMVIRIWFSYQKKYNKYLSPML